MIFEYGGNTKLYKKKNGDTLSFWGNDTLTWRLTPVFPETFSAIKLKPWRLEKNPETFCPPSAGSKIHQTSKWSGIRVQTSLKAKNFPEKLPPFDPSAALMLSNSYFPPRHVWLWLFEIEERGVCVCVWGGGWRFWSPEAIHVHLAAHLPYGDLSSAAHIWFQLKKAQNQGKCYGASLWE